MYKLFVWEGDVGLPFENIRFKSLKLALREAKGIARKYHLHKVRGKYLWYLPVDSLKGKAGLTSLAIVGDWVRRGM